MKKLFVPLHFMLLLPCTLEFEPAKQTIVNLFGPSKSLWSQYCLPLGQGWKNPSRPKSTSFLLVIRLLEASFNAISCTQSSDFGPCCVPNTLKRPWKKQRTMLTDYGGTEIASALSLVYSSLPKPFSPSQSSSSHTEAPGMSPPASHILKPRFLLFLTQPRTPS
ncbi:hypothetical protein GGU10DRAFT_70008 [Lentinula aff. detonsa]|uniref:Hydrophobin n=1 Tax=Lentinula aff. detonsa TaxID=2804958 RepID=A0AA38KMY6_9AGAR|nr:hypothetical protein GGU10DRAFT_70008 [Lentinula aff. detonsa]